MEPARREERAQRRLYSSADVQHHGSLWETKMVEDVRSCIFLSFFFFFKPRLIPDAGQIRVKMSFLDSDIICFGLACAHSRGQLSISSLHERTVVLNLKVVFKDFMHYYPAMWERAFLSFELFRANRN